MDRHFPRHEGTLDSSSVGPNIHQCHGSPHFRKEVEKGGPYSFLDPDCGATQSLMRLQPIASVI